MDNRVVENRVCTKCGNAMPLSSFHVYWSRKGNPPKSICIECEREHGRCYAKTEEGKEACKRAHKKYDVTDKGKATIGRHEDNERRKMLKRIAHNKWAHTEEGKEWLSQYRKSKAYKASVEKHMQSSKHKEYIESGRYREMSSRYWLSDKGKERTRRRSYARRSVDANVVNIFKPEDWEMVKEQYKNRCVYCGEKKTLTRDHLIPLSKGGQSVKENIVPACHSCNSKKKDRPVLLQILAMAGGK